MSAKERSDEDIAAAVQAGDTDAFGFLIERYEEKLLRYARKFLADIDDIRDLVQEAFIKAYVNIRSFDTGKKFSPWMYRIAHNEFVNALRKKSRISISIFDPDLIFPHPVSEETAASEAEKKELRRTLDQSLSKIPSKYREPLVLYYFEDMDYKEISDILQVPVGTVGIRLHRGKTLLRKMVDYKK